MVAHYVRDVGVASSSPVIPTRKGKQPQVVASLFALQGRVGMVRARPQPEWQINCQSVHIGCGRAQGPPLQSGCKITHTIRYGAEKCKILLPKFDTWRQGQIERKKGSLPPYENAVGRFFAKKCCRYGEIASPLHRNGNAITP